MNNFCNVLRFPRISQRILMYAVFATTLLTSCVVSRHDRSRETPSDLYHIKIENTETLPIDLNDCVLTSYYRPTSVFQEPDKAKVNIIDCTTAPINYLDGKSEKKFKKENLITLDAKDIEYISTSSDADVAPKMISISDLSNNEQCGRNRKSLKIEIRGVLAYRPQTSEGILYPNPEGDVFYNSATSSTKRGGTTLYYGAEVALLPQISTFGVGKHNAFNLGLMTGVWPVDGGLFLPISIHPRFTFNNVPSPISESCTTWYLFGDLGTAYDASGDVSFINTNSNSVSSWFAGLGVGRDYSLMEGVDLSVDLGCRYTSLGLPPNASLEKCLAEQGVEYHSFINRNAGQLFIRIGFTW